MQPDRFQAFAHPGDRRLVRHGAVRIFAGVERLGRVLIRRAAHLIELLGLCVPGFQLLIGKWPCRRDSAAGEFEFGKILFAVAEQHRAVEFRVAADDVVIPRVEGLAVLVEPGLFRPEMAALEDGARIAGLGRVQQALALLENDDLRAASGQAGGDGGAAHAGADDDDVGIGHDRSGRHYFNRSDRLRRCAFPLPGRRRRPWSG